MKALNRVNFCYAELLIACYILLEVKAENCFKKVFLRYSPGEGKPIINLHFFFPKKKTKQFRKILLPPNVCVATYKEHPKENEKRYLLKLGKFK